ncbi:MAG TPA: CPBP family intramembrane glutamic endopeptidase [Blastocatellia bacterium]
MMPAAAVRSEPLDAADRSTLDSRLSTRAFVIYVAAFLLVWSLRATVFIHIDESIKSDVARNLYSNAVKFTLWVLPALIILAVLRAKPFAYTKLTTRPDKRGLLISSVLLVIWFSLTVVGESVISGRNIGAMLSQRSSQWLGIVAGVSLSSISEEILFRGFFLNRLNETLSFWKSNFVAAALFMLAHVPYWISKGGFSGRVIRDLVNVVLLGCVFGWVMKKTNSLWPAIGAHIANNFLSGLMHA